LRDKGFKPGKMVEHENVALREMVARAVHLDIDVDIGPKGGHRTNGPFARFGIDRELFTFDIAEIMWHVMRYPVCLRQWFQGRFIGSVPIVLSF